MKNSKMRITLALVLALILVVSVFMAGCSSKEASGKTVPAKKPLVVFCNPGAQAPYCTGMNIALEALAKEKNWDLTILDAKLDAITGAKNLDQAIALKPDAIILMTIDGTATSKGTKAAADAGIPVIAECMRVLKDDEKYTTCYTGPDNYQEGQAAAEMMNEALGGKGNVVIIEGIPGQETTTSRGSGFTDKLKELNSNIQILKVNNGDWAKDKSVKVMEDFITRYGDDINGIYAQDDTMAAGAVIALKDAGIQKGKMVLIGIGGSKEGLAAVKSGDMYGTVLQSPKIEMIQTVSILEKIFKDGIKPPKQLENYLNYMTVPKVDTKNVDQYLPGEW